MKLQTQSDKQNAFTLIELMFTIALSMILLSVGIPSFKDMVQKSKVTAQINQLRGALFLARETAIQRNKKTVICPSSDSTSCSNSWSNGYIVFIDQNEDRTFNDGDILMQTYQNIEKDIMISWRAFGYKNSLQWLPTGITNHQNGTFEICYLNNQELAKALIISKSGNVRLSKDLDGDGIDENASGDDVRC